MTCQQTVLKSVDEILKCGHSTQNIEFISQSKVVLAFVSVD